MSRWSVFSLLLLAAYSAGCRHRRVIRRSPAVVARVMAPPLEPARRSDCVLGYELRGGTTLCLALEGMSLRRGAEVQKLTRRRVLDATVDRLALSGTCEDGAAGSMCVVTPTAMRTVALPAELATKVRWDVVLLDDETFVAGDHKQLLVVRGSKIVLREDIDRALKRDKSELCGPAGCLGLHRVGRSIHRLADGTLAFTVQHPTAQRTIARRLTLVLANDLRRVSWTRTSPGLEFADSDELTCEHGFTAWCRTAALALTPKSRERAFRVVEGACARGNRTSCLEAGYALDRGVPTERTFAFAYLDRACTAPRKVGDAEKRDDAEEQAEACAVLATYLGDESAGHLDRERARGLMQPRCDSGDKQACARIAALILDGKPEKDAEKRALATLEEACAKKKEDNTFACYRLALAHDEGRGVAQDGAQAEALLRKACLEDEYVEPRACEALARRSDADPKKIAAAAEAACTHWFAQSCPPIPPKP